MRRGQEESFLVDLGDCQERVGSRGGRGQHEWNFSRWISLVFRPNDDHILPQARQWDPGRSNATD